MKIKLANKLYGTAKLIWDSEHDLSKLSEEESTLLNNLKRHSRESGLELGEIASMCYQCSQSLMEIESFISLIDKDGYMIGGH